MSETRNGTEGSRLPDGEPDLTIEPITGWRRWLVSPARSWETWTGPILRGAWGRAWPHRRSEARCLRRPTRPTPMLGGFNEILEWQETGRHREPPPHIGCRCGIYAMKPGRVDQAPTDVFQHLPVLTGFVELSGKVIEAASGYRGREAVVIPPFELNVPCAGGLSTSSRCANPPSQVYELEYGYRGFCSAHLSSAHSPIGEDVDEWLDRVVVQLVRRYQADVVNIEKGRADGYR